jgi:glycosyltransferase involved in cell wall biosynthesis
MKFSVIIPLYNAKKTIKTTIESARNQTYSESIEIIVVNDGSIDGCEKIVEDMVLDHQINRIIKFINKPNGGASSARNRAMKEATGKYIAFLDADDIWHPQKLELVLNLLENNEEIDLLGHSYTLNENFSEKYTNKKPRKISFFQLLIKNFAVTPSIVVRKEALELFDEKMKFAEDHELWLRIASKKNIYFLDLPLVLLGRKPLSSGGLSAQKWNMRKGEIQMYINTLKYKKILFLALPFLIIFSLIKYVRLYLKDYFGKY